MTASASDADGSVSNVEFFVNGSSIGTDNSAPYSINYTIPADGVYTLYADATDNDNNTTTSSTNAITAGVVSLSTSSRISSGMDDVEEEDDGVMYTTSSDLELVADGSRGHQTIGLRFTGLSIPQGATITSAYIQFTVDETNTGTTNLTIWGEATDDAAAFSTSSYNVSNRSKTSASVNWSPAAWNSVGSAGSDQKTPELKNIIQEIVNRSGFTTSSDVVMIVSGTGERTAEAYDGTSSSAPILYVDYTTGSGNEPANRNPTVSITSPSNGTSFDQGTVVTISADASDSDGSITSVEFFVDDVSIGSENKAPYSMNWTIGTGSYSLTAKATDNEGAEATSTVINVTGNVVGGGGTDVLTIDYFESGWGNWTDGGGDCRRYTGGTYTFEGSAAIGIQDNSGVASSFYLTNSLNLTSYDELTLDFSYDAVSMDNANEDFWLQYYDGSQWITVASWARSIDFNNNTFYTESVTISSRNYTFPSNASVRFMCDASGNADDVYIDAITISASSPVGGSQNQAPTISITSPSNGANIVDYIGNTLSIATTASDADGAVSKVDFYQGSTLIGTDNSAPYSINWTISGEGNFSFSAIATDNQGATENSSISISVTEPISSPQTFEIELRHQVMMQRKLKTVACT